jgi:hypothetical protein
VYTILLLVTPLLLPNPFHKGDNLPFIINLFSLNASDNSIFRALSGEITVGFSCGLFELQQDFTGGSFDVSEIVSAGDSIEMLPALESVSCKANGI